MLSSVSNNQMNTDVNPIVDPGAPTSAGGMLDITEICDSRGIEVTIEPPRDVYIHGWGMDCANGKPIIGTWWL